MLVVLPAVDEKLTMRPHPASRIAGRTAREGRNVPFRFTPITKSHSSSPMSNTAVRRSTPAAFTSM